MPAKMLCNSARRSHEVWDGHAGIRRVARELTECRRACCMLAGRRYQTDAAAAVHRTRDDDDDDDDDDEVEENELYGQGQRPRKIV